MKIAFDIQPVLSGTKTGIGFHTDGLVRSLQKQHPEDEFVLNYYSRDVEKEKGLIKEYQPDGVTVVVQKCSYLIGRVHRLLGNIIKIPYHCFFKENADITHFFNFCIPPGVVGKKVVTIHDLTIKRYPETVRFRTKLMLNLNLKHTVKRADAIVAVSEFTKQEILEFFKVPEGKVYVVPNGVDTNRFKTNYAQERIEAAKERYGIQGQYLLYLGTIEPRKNLDSLVQAYAILAEKLGDKVPKLVIAGGKGWLCQSFFDALEASPRKKDIILTGYVADEDVPLLMSGAMCFCFPSLYEGFGMPVLEAMACGTPVLVSKETVMEEIIEEAGIKVNPFSIDSIAEGLLAICRDENLQKELMKQGYERVERYTWKSAEEKLYQVYTEVLTK